MASLPRALLDWLDDRSGYRAVVRRALDEVLPSGTGWAFTLGSILLVLLVVQVATGAVLTLYYVPTPDHAWDSVQFITREVSFGRVVRNLHVYGASFIVVAAAVHLLRVFFFGSYKRPRELTWMSGILLLLVILAFALTGYLLPWDQRAYWATVVTLNVAESAPLAGEALAALLRGGATLGALTLSRWHSLHVIWLPAALALLVAVHLVLVRRHHVSGPVTASPGPGRPFYPDHFARAATAAGIVFLALFVLAAVGGHESEAMANPAASDFVPRPEWYFLWQFQLLKYFPGRLEVIGAHVIPGLLVLLLLVLPFFDTRPERRPWKRPLATSAALLVVATIGTLTALGLRDAPAAEAADWTAVELGGYVLTTSEACARCHDEGGLAAPVEEVRLRRDDAWLGSHVADPEVIAPGLRPPQGTLGGQQVRAVVAYLGARRRGLTPPEWPDAPETRASGLIGAYCLGCHSLEGEGSDMAPRLDRAGRDRDAEWLAGWIANPSLYEYDTDMPAFADTLSADDIRLVASHLAGRK